MIVSINQPAYLPWLGYFQRIALSDCHVILDHVQFEKNSFTNRNKVCTPQGWCWLTIPMYTKNRFRNLAITDIEIKNTSHWSKKHWKTLYQNYHRAPYFKTYESELEACYNQEWTNLANLCTHMTRLFMSWLGLDTCLKRSSEMSPQGKKDDLILDLCTQMKANIYLSGALGHQYLDESRFIERGMQVIYQNYKHPVYNQCQKRPFEPFMAIIDLLVNHGPYSLDILLCGQTSVNDILEATS